MKDKFRLCEIKKKIDNNINFKRSIDEMTRTISTITSELKIETLEINYKFLNRIMGDLNEKKSSKSLTRPSKHQ